MLMRQSEVAAGNFDALLAELVTADAPRQRELEAMLARGLTDPAVLTESPVLPAAFCHRSFGSNKEPPISLSLSGDLATKRQALD